MSVINLNPKYPTNLSLQELERVAEVENNELALRIVQAAREAETVTNLLVALGEAYNNVDEFLEALYTVVAEHFVPDSMVETIMERLELPAELEEKVEAVLRDNLTDQRSEYERQLKGIWLKNILLGSEGWSVKDTLIDAHVNPAHIDVMPNFWDNKSEYMNPFESREERELRHNPPAKASAKKRGKKK